MTGADTGRQTVAGAPPRARLRFRGLSEWATRLTSARVHQADSSTWPDRYPALFSAAQALLRDRPHARILSFGCSSGEEVVTLRRYFPDAAIVGAEINRHLLRTCRGLPLDGNVTFVTPSAAALAAHGPFDAIFCMAVLTRRPHEVERRGLTDISAFYPFELFSGTVRELASQLTEGGLLIIEHALYRVDDALDALPLVAVGSHGVGLAKGPRFAPSGRRLEGPQLIARIFRRRPS